MCARTVGTQEYGRRMSFIPPPNAPIDNELARAKEQELERRASQYAQTHPDGRPPQRHVARHFLDRTWDRLRARKANGNRTHGKDT